MAMVIGGVPGNKSNSGRDRRRLSFAQLFIRITNCIRFPAFVTLELTGEVSSQMGWDMRIGLGL